MRKNSFGQGLVIFFVIIGVLFVIGSIGEASEPKCIKAGCDNKQASGSSYCYLHKPYTGKREAPAYIANDGKQTPMRGHPVFIAQHATATCCRECIRKWHKMQPGKELSQVQQDYLVDVIMTWIQKEIERQEHKI